MDPDHGFFGWMDKTNVIYCFFVMGICCRAGTFISYTYAFYSFSSIVVTNAMTSEPVISQTIAVLFGLDKIPGAVTIIGMMISCVGIYLLSRTLDTKNSNY